MRHCSCRCRRTSAVIYRLYNQFAYMNRRPFGVNYEFVSAGYTRGRVRWPWIVIKCKSSSSEDPVGGRLQEANLQDDPTHEFFAFPRDRQKFSRDAFFLIFLVRWLVEILVGKMDSVGFIERHVANNSIGERLKNYWQRLLMLMIHDMIMVYNYFCINFLCGFTYNRLNLIDASIQTPLR